VHACNFKQLMLAGLSIDRDTNELATTSSCHIFRFSSLSICAWWVVLKHAQFQGSDRRRWTVKSFVYIFASKVWRDMYISIFVALPKTEPIHIWRRTVFRFCFVFVTSVIRLNRWNSKLNGLAEVLNSFHIVPCFKTQSF